MTVRQVLEKLAAEGRIPAGREGAAALALGVEATGPSTPVYARILSGIAGWVAAILFLVFLFGVRIVDVETGAIVVGGILVVAATIIRRAMPHAIFPGQLALATCIAGKALVVFGVATFLEVVADKVPAVDHALDALGTPLRLGAGRCGVPGPPDGAGALLPRPRVARIALDRAGEGDRRLRRLAPLEVQAPDEGEVPRARLELRGATRIGERRVLIADLVEEDRPHRTDLPLERRMSLSDLEQEVRRVL